MAAVDVGELPGAWIVVVTRLSEALGEGEDEWGKNWGLLQGCGAPLSRSLAAARDRVSALSGKSAVGPDGSQAPPRCPASMWSGCGVPQSVGFLPTTLVFLSVTTSFVSGVKQQLEAIQDGQLQVRSAHIQFGYPRVVWLMTGNRFEYVKHFEQPDNLLPNTWVVVRIDGRGFTKFSTKYGFEKPNDKRALDLMNAAARQVVSEISDITVAYGVSDEYRHVLA
jgi:hypothetical protein